MRVLILLAVMTTFAFGQAPDEEGPGFPPALERFLMLDEGMAEEIVAANEEFRADPIRREKLETLHQLKRDLAAAINAEVPDVVLVGQLAVDIELLGRELQEEATAFQEDMYNQILLGDEEILQRIQALERAKIIIPLYNQALRFHLVDPPRQLRHGHGGGEAPPPAE